MGCLYSWIQRKNIDKYFVFNADETILQATLTTEKILQLRATQKLNTAMS